MRRKMIQPLPADLGNVPSERFKRFAKALLTVPKAEIETPEQAIARLEAEKVRIDREIVALTTEIKERKRRTKR